MREIPIKIGQNFGRLIFRGRINEYRGAARKAIWDCECGTIGVVLPVCDVLARDGTRSCGCLYKEAVKKKNEAKFIGNKYGHLTIIGRTNKKVNNHSIYECLCDCGNICCKQPSYIQKGGSCGCQRFKKMRKNAAAIRRQYIGRKFGKLVVQAETNKKTNDGHVLYECLCSCGKIICVPSNRLLSGNTKSCGCLLEESRHKQKRSVFTVSAHPSHSFEEQCKILESEIDLSNNAGRPGVPRPYRKLSHSRICAMRRAAKGVYFSIGKWRPYIKINGKHYWLKTQDTEEAARKIRLEAIEYVEKTKKIPSHLLPKPKKAKKYYLNNKNIWVAEVDGKTRTYQTETEVKKAVQLMLTGTIPKDGRSRNHNRLGKGRGYSFSNGFWRVRLTIDDKPTYLGAFRTEQEAQVVAKARQKNS